MTPEQKAEIGQIVNELPTTIDQTAFRSTVNEQTRGMTNDQRLEGIRQIAAEVSETAPREQ